MDKTKLMEIGLNILLTLIGAIIGAILSYFITRWSMNKGKKDELIGASKEIKGTADHIIETLNLVKQHNMTLTKILSLIDNGQKNDEISSIQEYLACNPQLYARLQQKMVEKRMIGKYICKFITHQSCIAIDCGTSAAWAYFEIAKIYKSSLKVITNSIFVPTIFCQEYDYNQYANFWGVKEEPSFCYITSGNYFPSYGGILRTEDDSINYYSSILGSDKPDTILMGCTSFTTAEGPFARSGANRRFKEAMLMFASENKATNLFILLDIAKVGKRIGEPSSVKIWDSIKQRTNVFILIGFSGTRKEFEIISDETKAIVSEEVRIMSEQKRLNQILIIDNIGEEIDLKKYFKM